MPTTHHAPHTLLSQFAPRPITQLSPAAARDEGRSDHHRPLLDQGDGFQKRCGVAQQPPGGGGVGSSRGLGFVYKRQPPPPPASSSVALRLQTQAPMDMGINLLRARRTTSFEIALDIARHDQLRKYGPVPRAVSEGAYLLGHYARKVRVLEVQFFLTSMRVGQGSCFAIDGGGGVAAMRRGGGSRCENEKGATTFSSAIGRVIKMSKSHSTHEHNI